VDANLVHLRREDLFPLAGERRAQCHCQRRERVGEPRKVIHSAEPYPRRLPHRGTLSRRSDGGRLILFFGRTGANEWRIKKTMIGWYG
jgi:hypothetical protein